METPQAWGPGSRGKDKGPPKKGDSVALNSSHWKLKARWFALLVNVTEPSLAKLLGLNSGLLRGELLSFENCRTMKLSGFFSLGSQYFTLSSF